MIYSIITMAGLVIYTLGPWPAGSLDQCLAGATEIIQQNPKTVMDKKIDAWCAKYDERPKLGERLSPPREIKQMMQ